eukprot:scaffold284983_cov34-Tisochrysis_lutea.AAC.1
MQAQAKGRNTATAEAAAVAAFPSIPFGRCTSEIACRDFESYCVASAQGFVAPIWRFALSAAACVLENSYTTSTTLVVF